MVEAGRRMAQERPFNHARAWLYETADTPRPDSWDHPDDSIAQGVSDFASVEHVGDTIDANRGYRAAVR